MPFKMLPHLIICTTFLWGGLQRGVLGDAEPRGFLLVINVAVCKGFLYENKVLLCVQKTIEEEHSMYLLSKSRSMGTLAKLPS